VTVASNAPVGTDIKQCPDCAETVKFEARICRFCGHKFWTLPWAETEDTRVPRVAAAPERPPLSTTGDALQRPKPARVRVFDWALHPLAAMMYPAAPLLVAAAIGSTPRFLPYAVAAMLSIAAVVLVHYDRRAVGDPSLWWPVMVLLAGPFAYLPYTIVRRRSGGRVASPIGLVLAGAGAAGMVLAAFLPVVDASRYFVGVSNNTFFNVGDGWLLVSAAAVGLVGVGLAARQSPAWGWLPVLAGLLAVLVAVAYGTGSGLDVYPYVPSTQLGGSARPVRADPGAGIYAAAVAGGLCILGGVMAALTACGARPSGLPAPLDTRPR